MNAKTGSQHVPPPERYGQYSEQNVRLPFVNAVATAITIAIVCVSLVGDGHVAAQDTPKPPPGKPAAAAPTAAPSGVQLPAMPQPELLIALIRSTLAALNHANQTGNYSVLRDMGAPGFQAAHTAADLAQLFTLLRSQRFDLLPAVVLTPELNVGPTITKEGLLHLGGTFPSKPEEIRFEMLFQPVNGQWRVFGLSVNPPPQAPAAAAPAAGGKVDAKKDSKAPVAVPKSEKGAAKDK